MISARLFGCLVAFALLGWLARGLFSVRGKTEGEEHFFDVLTGMALLSFVCFGLAAAGWFHGRTILGSFALLGLALWLRSGCPFPPLKEILLLILTAWLVSLIALILYRLTPPYEAIVAGDDASTYSAAAGQLASTGKLSYTDTLVLEMTPSQREAFFRNSYREDWTGPHIRFPGGVRLADPRSGAVQFAFYHMTPVWLAFAIKFFGPIDYQIWISLISALTYLVLFFLGRRLGGSVAGIALPLLLFLYYPQQYFSRFPLSEPTAQLFFLAGLLSLVQSVNAMPGPHSEQMRRTGLLWGVAFLSRIDALYITVLFFVVGLACIPLFARNRRRWQPLLRILAVCALAAVLYQFAGGEYVSLFTNSQNLSHSVLTDLGLDVITTANVLVRAHTGLTCFLFLSAAALILFAPCPGTVSPGRKFHPAVSAVLGVAGAIAMLFPVTGAPDSTLVLNHIRWFLPYAPAALYILLGAGILCTAFLEIRKPAAQICLLFLTLALALYLFRPLIQPGQPWSMRRFVPILIPLFFVLGLSGWSRALALIRAAGSASRAAILLAAAGASALLLYSKSAYLLREPLYQGIFASCDGLAGRIPQGALVLIPDAMAGLHLELPLRYRNGVDTLMLPLDYKTGRRLSPAIRSFLDTRMQKGPVILLSSEGTDLLYPLWKYYRPLPAGSQPFSIFLVKRADRYLYPERTERMTFNTSLYRLSTSVPPPLAGNEISFDASQITFLHFHEPEAGFRWTRDESTLTDFVYPTNGKEVDLLIEIGPAPPGFRPGDPGLTVMVNYVIPAEFVSGEGHILRYRLKSGTAGEIRAVSLLTSTFLEQADIHPRDLGISFVRLTFRY